MWQVLELQEKTLFFLFFFFIGAILKLGLKECKRQFISPQQAGCYITMKHSDLVMDRKGTF